ncbi:MAG: SOS response-associated peptidase [Thiohalophilus sp.]|jgi:putative SOS response-associated peptidase YedK
MCGRLALYTPPDELAQWLDAVPRLALAPHYNLAPGLDLAACRLDNEGQRELVALHWGLVPHWSKGPDSRYSMINARADTVEQKPAYREPFRHKRCLIPADGFYEWHRTEQGKQPYYFRLQQETPLAFAGLWDHWQGEDRSINSATIIVTEANDLMRPVHDRMPVILPPETWEQWLDPNQSTTDLKTMLQPYTGTDLICYPVSKVVNNARNDRADLLQPVEPE